MMLNESETSEGQPNAKKGYESDQRTNGDVVAITEVQTADILKFDIDCCEEVLEY